MVQNNSSSVTGMQTLPELDLTIKECFMPNQKTDAPEILAQYTYKLLSSKRHTDSNNQFFIWTSGLSADPQKGILTVRN